ncbi:MAG: hypothetical protein JEZ10_00465 [Verrucomicrobia bacterium]|nr:hypothetical protein [Verrucomicrobiota bacterium]
MKMKPIFFLPLTVLMLSGCKTIETEPRPLSWQQQQAYCSKVQDPRVFGLSIYDTPAGPQIRGGGRLHPSQAAALPMQTKKGQTVRPVVRMSGSFGMEWPVLLDLSSSRTWLEFSTAKKMMARPVGERKAELIRLSNDETAACLSIVSSLRLGQLFIENPLVYVRMADGPIGPLARGMVEPELKGVVGWDLLKKMEQIHLLYSVGQVALFTTEPYEPNPALVVAMLPLVEHAGACAVRGIVDGKEGLVLIDPAGDFEIAGAASTVQLAPGLSFSSSEPPAVSPGGIRIGARLLQNYDITICPQAGVIYFEKPLTDER